MTQIFCVPTSQMEFPGGVTVDWSADGATWQAMPASTSNLNLYYRVRASGVDFSSAYYLIFFTGGSNAGNLGVISAGVGVVVFGVGSVWASGGPVVYDLKIETSGFAVILAVPGGVVYSVAPPSAPTLALSGGSNELSMAAAAADSFNLYNQEDGFFANYPASGNAALTGDLGGNFSGHNWYATAMVGGVESAVSNIVST